MPVRLALYRPWADRLIYGLALVGLGVVAHLGLQEARGFAGGCSGFNPDAIVEAPSGCAAALSSAYSTVFGVSNVTLGLVFWVAVAALTAALVAAPARIGALKRLRLVLLVGGSGYALYLITVLLSGKAGGVCTFCLTSHVLTLSAAALAAADAVLRPPRP